MSSTRNGEGNPSLGGCHYTQGSSSDGRTCIDHLACICRRCSGGRFQIPHGRGRRDAQTVWAGCCVQGGPGGLDGMLLMAAKGVLVPKGPPLLRGRLCRWLKVRSVKVHTKISQSQRAAGFWLAAWRNSLSYSMQANGA